MSRSSFQYDTLTKRVQIGIHSHLIQRLCIYISYYKKFLLAKIETISEIQEFHISIVYCFFQEIFLIKK